MLQRKNTFDWQCKRISSKQCNKLLCHLKHFLHNDILSYEDKNGKNDKTVRLDAMIIKTKQKTVYSRIFCGMALL